MPTLEPLRNPLKQSHSICTPQTCKTAKFILRYNNLHWQCYHLEACYELFPTQVATALQALSVPSIAVYCCHLLLLFRIITNSANIQGDRKANIGL
jgi:hypothetical protein